MKKERKKKREASSSVADSGEHNAQSAPDTHGGGVVLTRSWRGRLRNYFITGLIATVPIVATIYLIFWVAAFIDAIPSTLLPGNTELHDYFNDYAPPGLGILAILLFVTLVGWLTSNFLGRALFKTSERILDGLPLVRTIYKTLKQIADSMLADSRSFDRAVLVEYPLAGSWCVAFVTSNAPGEVGARLGRGGREECISVFVPTTPNPTSGFLLFVERGKTIELDMTVEDAARTIISAGMITPAWNNAKQPLQLTGSPAQQAGKAAKKTAGNSTSAKESRKTSARGKSAQTKIQGSE